MRPKADREFLSVTAYEHCWRGDGPPYSLPKMLTAESGPSAPPFLPLLIRQESVPGCSGLLVTLHFVQPCQTAAEAKQSLEFWASRLGWQVTDWKNHSEV